MPSKFWHFVRQGPRFHSSRGRDGILPGPRQRPGGQEHEHRAGPGPAPWRMCGRKGLTPNGSRIRTPSIHRVPPPPNPQSQEDFRDASRAPRSGRCRGDGGHTDSCDRIRAAGGCQRPARPQGRRAQPQTCVCGLERTLAITDLCGKRQQKGEETPSSTSRPVTEEGL